MRRALSMRRALLAAALWACGRVLPAPPPAPTEIAPAAGLRGRPLHVRISGTNFLPRALHQLGGGGAVDDRFQVRIGGVALANIAWMGTVGGRQVLEADVPPDLPVGRWDVEVKDPAGRVGVLKSAFTERVPLPATLSISAASIPAQVSRGQSFTAGVLVTNTGDIAALGVQITTVSTSTGGAQLSAGGAQLAPGAASFDLESGAARLATLAFTETGTAPGSVDLLWKAAATDAASGTPVATSADLGAILVQAPAALSLQVPSAPASIDRGQSFSASVAVRNTGGATARSVTAAPVLTGAGGARATGCSTAAPVDLVPGQSASFTWTCLENGSAAGALSLSATASAADGNSAAALFASSPSATILVQEPAALSAAWTVPASASLNAGFTARLTVTNSGGAAALRVVPAASVTGTARATLTGPSPASATVASGASQDFTWTATATAAGTFQLSANASGADANTSAAVSASALSSPITIDEATTIAANPFSSDGTLFSYLFSYQDQIYLGPNGSGTAAVRMRPDGSSPAQVNWQLEVDTTPKTGARNSFYQPPSTALCHTIGFPGCAQGTAQCGPDNESGHGLFFSGFAPQSSGGTTEWYALSGASTIGGVHYLYMTNPSLPLAPGGYDDLAFVQIQAGQYGSTRMATAGHFFNGKLYLGFLDTGVSSPNRTAPVLNVLTRMPGLPGFVANSTNNTDLIDLQAVVMPGIGASGSPANTGPSALMIDTIADFNGDLYLGNNGGLIRSTNGNPGPCTGSCSDWTPVTPTQGAWINKTSVAIDLTVLGKLEPALRAIPGIVPFGGRLFVARNTTAGPQLWSCAPTSTDTPPQCQKSDWSLVAGASDLTQFGDGGNTAIAMLAASGSHLYVGFNNAAGIGIWRTSKAGASAVSDFTGHADCVAGTSGCTPLGGAGLGNGSTHIFDGKVLTAGGQEWLYVSSGDGTTGPRVTRLAP